MGRGDGKKWISRSISQSVNQSINLLLTAPTQRLPGPSSSTIFMATAGIERPSKRPPVTPSSSVVVVVEKVVVLAAKASLEAVSGGAGTSNCSLVLVTSSGTLPVCDTAAQMPPARKYLRLYKASGSVSESALVR